MQKGKLLKAGDKIFNKELGNTLQVIADAGNADPFYNGQLSATIVRDVKSKGNVWLLFEMMIVWMKNVK